MPIETNRRRHELAGRFPRSDPLQSQNLDGAGDPRPATAEDHQPTRRQLREERTARSAPQTTRRQAARPQQAPRPARRITRRGLASKLLSTGALIFSAALVVGMTLPANAFVTAADAQAPARLSAAAAGTAEGQSLTTDDGEALAANRDGYTITSFAQTARAKYGTKNFNYATAWTGSIRWPFPYPVPISSGFGARVAPCQGCSSFHEGVDFDPGGGTPIYAVADGVVSLHSTAGALGNHVQIAHDVNGLKFDSVYGHMKSGSSPLQAGDVVKAGDFIGLVGSTGASTGNHLHLEIHLGGVPVDPYAWLKANATS